MAPNAIGTTRFFDSWNFGFNLNWELDFWGQFRRAVAAADDNLDANVEGYDAAIVTMLGDIAQNYVRVRTDQEQIKTQQANVELQRGVLQFIEKRLNAGFRQTELDFDQALSNVKQTEAAIPALEIDMRQAEDALCVLLGMPPVDLANVLGMGPIPTTPPEVAIGIPCDLLRRRPDVRQAERLAAAQAEQIGIAASRLVSRLLHQRHARLPSPKLPRSVQEYGLQRQCRSVVPMEPAELRPDREQCPLAGRAIPGSWRSPTSNSCSKPANKSKTGW